MNSKTNTGGNTSQNKDKGMLEKLAQAIDPPGREISDAELSDPGANIPDSEPGKEDSDRKLPK